MTFRKKKQVLEMFKNGSLASVGWMGVGVRGVLPNTNSLICTASHEYRIARSLNALSSKYVGKSNTLALPLFAYLSTNYYIYSLLLYILF